MAGILLLPVFAMSSGRKPPWKSIPINTVVDGVVRKGFNAIDVDGNKMISIRTVNKLFGGRVQWKRVSRKVVYHSEGRIAEFELDSSTAVIAGKFVKLSPPVRAWGSDVYLSADILIHPEFQRIVASSVQWDPVRANLTIDPIPAVGPPRVYSYPLKSQVLLELGPYVNYRVLSLRKDVLTIRLFGGRARDKEKIVVDDGAIKSVELLPRARTSDLVIILSSAAMSPIVTLTGTLPVHQGSKDGKSSASVASTREKSGTSGQEEAQQILTIEVDNIIGFGLSTETVKSKNINKIEKSKTGKSNGALNGKKLERHDKSKDVSDLPTIISKKEMPKKVAGDPMSHDLDYFDLNDDSDEKPTSNKRDGALLALSPFRTIVIDPGHGGKDVGAVGPNGTLEKEVNLQIALALAKVLKKEGRFNVILTRDKDVFIPLQERSSIANKAKADLFISLHCNAGIQRDSRGFEIFYLSENATDDEAAAVARRENAVIELEGVVGKARQELEGLLWSLARNEHMNESAAIAGHISQHVVRRIKIQNRGVKQAGFYVLRGTSTPAILIESAFISHPKEEGLLRSSRFHRKLVDALFAGLMDFERKKIQIRLAQKS